MDGAGRDHMHAAIQEDQREHPQCSYSTVRSHFSSFLNGSSKAETLTKIIRNCQGVFNEHNPGGRRACNVLKSDECMRSI